MFKRCLMLCVVMMMATGVAWAGGETMSAPVDDGCCGDVEALQVKTDMLGEAVFAVGIENARLEMVKQDKVDDSSYYTGVFGGANIFANGDPGFDTGWVAGIFAGVEASVFRGELEYQYLRADFKEFESNISVNSLMGNVYYDFVEWGSFTPYLTTGIGVGWFDMGNYDLDQTSAVAKFGGGLDVVVVEDMSVGARYVYFSALNGVDYDASVITGVFTLSF